MAVKLHPEIRLTELAKPDSSSKPAAHSFASTACPTAGGQYVWIDGVRFMAVYRDENAPGRPIIPIGNDRASLDKLGQDLNTLFATAKFDARTTQKTTLFFRNRDLEEIEHTGSSTTAKTAKIARNQFSALNIDALAAPIIADLDQLHARAEEEATAAAAAKAPSAKPLTTPPRQERARVSLDPAHTVEAGGRGNCAAYALNYALTGQTSGQQHETNAANYRRDTAAYMQRDVVRLAADSYFCKQVLNASADARLLLPVARNATVDVVGGLAAGVKQKLIQDYATHIAQDGRDLDQPFFTIQALLQGRPIFVLNRTGGIHSEHYPADNAAGRQNPLFVYYNGGSHYKGVNPPDAIRRFAIEKINAHETEREIDNLMDVVAVNSVEDEEVPIETQNANILQAWDHLLQAQPHAANAIATVIAEQFGLDIEPSTGNELIRENPQLLSALSIPHVRIVLAHTKIENRQLVYLSDEYIQMEWRVVFFHFIADKDLSNPDAYGAGLEVFKQKNLHAALVFEDILSDDPQFFKRAAQTDFRKPVDQRNDRDLENAVNQVMAITYVDPETSALVSNGAQLHRRPEHGSVAAS